MNSKEPNFKYEAVPLQTYNNWPVEFLDKNELAAAGFHFTNFKDVVLCILLRVTRSVETR